MTTSGKTSNARSGRHGFTFVEVLVSAVILALLSGACLTAVRSLSGTEDFTRNRVLAVNLLQKSQEEVRRAAPVFYDRLGKGDCDFGQSNSCNFSQNIAAEFPGITRTLTVEDVGSVDFKRVTVQVQWQERGAGKGLSSVMLIARPPEPLPGNLIGLIRQQNGSPLGNVSIELRFKGDDPRFSSSRSQWSTTMANDGQRMNYNFANNTGVFQLQPGLWDLRASRSSASTVQVQDILIEAFVERRVDLTMQYNPPPPKPKPPPNPNPKPKPEPKPLPGM